MCGGVEAGNLCRCRRAGGSSTLRISDYGRVDPVYLAEGGRKRGKMRKGIRQSFKRQKRAQDRMMMTGLGAWDGYGGDGCGE